VDPVVAKLLGKAHDVAKEWRGKEDDAVYGPVIVNFSKQLTDVAAKDVSRGRRSKVHAAGKNATYEVMAASERFKDREGAPSLGAPAVNQSQGKLQLGDAVIQLPNDRFEGARLQRVVRVEKEDEWRVSVIESVKTSGELAAVLDPERVDLVLADNLPRSVGRTIVDDDDLTVAPLLIEHAPNGAANEVLVIVTRDDHCQLCSAILRASLGHLLGEAARCVARLFVQGISVNRHAGWGGWIH
jgi:hypothetical protein